MSIKGIKLITSPLNNNPIHMDYKKMLTGVFHKWVDSRELHDQSPSLYSFSDLWSLGKSKRVGKKGEQLLFPNGVVWYISAFDEKVIDKIKHNMEKDNTIFHEMCVMDCFDIDPHDFIKEDGQYSFYVKSSVLVREKNKKNNGELTDHYLTKNDGDFFERSKKVLTSNMKHKLEKAGMDSEGIEISFNKEPKKKIINYNNIFKRTNVSPITIKGSKEQVCFAWSVGVGSQTGIGLGFVGNKINNE